MNNTLFEILVYSCDQTTFHDHMVAAVTPNKKTRGFAFPEFSRG